jgi:alpha,alpha-trehalase
MDFSTHFVTGSLPQASILPHWSMSSISRKLPPRLLVALALFGFADKAAKADAPAGPDPDEVRKVKEYIHATWPDTIRTTKSKENPMEMELPTRFTVPTPGAGFRMFFYWDTYFTSLGLIRDGYSDLTCDNAETMFYLIETLGFVPNYTFVGHDYRSQPPVAALQVGLCLPFRQNRAWRERAYRALKTEYIFWMSQRVFADGLNHYGNHAYPKQIAEFEQVISSRLPSLPSDPVARKRLVVHAVAEAESGWDFSPRWDRCCEDWASVDLNSLLYIEEREAAELARDLNNGEEPTWRERMETRRTLMNRWLWDDQRGLFVDYDEARRERNPRITAASFFPLFAGIAAEKQAVRSAAALAGLITDHGVDTCLPSIQPQVYQWDSPNLWPPLQWIAVKGLLESGQRNLAVTIAKGYIATVAANFQRTHKLWEKYNARTGGIDVKNEYDMPAMMGWSAGVFLACCEVAGY